MHGGSGPSQTHFLCSRVRFSSICCKEKGGDKNLFSNFEAQKKGKFSSFFLRGSQTWPPRVGRGTPSIECNGKSLVSCCCKKLQQQTRLTFSALESYYPIVTAQRQNGFRNLLLHSAAWLHGQPTPTAVCRVQMEPTDQPVPRHDPEYLCLIYQEERPHDAQENLGVG